MGWANAGLLWKGAWARLGNQGEGQVKTLKESNFWSRERET